jgi:hypothetical protein
MADTRNTEGSVWHRWDPHIHTPGTVLNDQFGGPDPWDQFLTQIERSDPPIRALGITDYCSVDLYQTVLEKKRQGRLPGVDLIFPNVELRYSVGTARGLPINVHFLVSPEDRDHLDQIRRFLRALTFSAYGETFRCERADLIRLGRAHDRTVQDDAVALAAGTNQFKLNPDQLREEWRHSNWAQENVLVAVAVGSNDGTSGLQSDAGFATLRKEIERFAHIIFSSQPAQRDFWLGRGVVTIQQLRADWDGPKPCLHGSDAHNHASVGVPALNRFCWIKGDITFEALRQACLEPELRTFIGSTPPRGALPSQVITSAAVTNASWFKSGRVPLNPGLVSIIGARGSGKTALAEVIAAGSFALSPHLSERSFIHRAKAHLGDSEAVLTWEDGDPTSNAFKHVEAEDFVDSARVQYLSQQFVDTLCLAEGLTDELLSEIERVIYQAHPAEERMGTTTFRELLELRTAMGRAVRQRHDEVLASVGNEINIERERRASLSLLQKQHAERTATIAKDKRDRSSLIGKGSDERVKLLDQVSIAAEAVRHRLEQARRRRQALVALKDEADDIRANQALYRLRQLKLTYVEAGLSDENWQAFLMRFAGDVDRILDGAIRDIDKLVLKLSGRAQKTDPAAPPSPASLIPDGAELAQQPSIHCGPASPRREVATACNPFSRTPRTFLLSRVLSPEPGFLHIPAKRFNSESRC